MLRYTDKSFYNSLETQIKEIITYKCNLACDVLFAIMRQRVGSIKSPVNFHLSHKYMKVWYF